MADPGIPGRSANTAYVDAVMHGRVHPFGHREHVKLAYALVAEYGVDDAAQRCGQILSHMASAHGAPERFHVTMTVAWVKAVSHHMSEAPDVVDFDGLLERFPQLLHHDLLDAHYSRDVMFSDEARQAEVEPDRRPIPD